MLHEDGARNNAARECGFARARLASQMHVESGADRLAGFVEEPGAAHKNRCCCHCSNPLRQALAASDLFSSVSLLALPFPLALGLTDALFQARMGHRQFVHSPEQGRKGYGHRLTGLFLFLFFLVLHQYPDAAQKRPNRDPRDEPRCDICRRRHLDGEVVFEGDVHLGLTSNFFLFFYYRRLGNGHHDFDWCRAAASRSRASA